MSRPLMWRAIHLVAPVDYHQAQAALVSLAALPSSPKVIIETIASSHQVRWRVGAEPWAMAGVIRSLTTHLAGLRVESAVSDDTVEWPTAAATVHIPGSERLPLREDATEPVTRSLFAALAAAGIDEEVRLQLVLGPRLAPRRVADIDAGERRAVMVKLGQHGFGCALRVAATATNPARAHALIAGIGSALRGLEVPGLRIILSGTSKTSVASAASPWFWPLWLSSADLVPLLGWPTAEPPLVGVPAAHPRLLAPAKATPRTGRMLGTFTGDATRVVAISERDSLRHLHMLGPTGVGKSTLMANLALQDARAGRGVVVIDPKGDLVEDILERLPGNRLDDVVVLDAADEAPVGINGLVGANPELAADNLLAVFHSLYADSWGPRTQDILHASLLTLARRGDASLVMVPLLLTNPGFRRSVVGRVAKADPLGLGTFWAGFDAMTDGERTQAIQPLMNKLRQVLLRPGLRAIFGQREPKFDIGDVFTKRRILLVSLAKGTVGAEAAQLLGSIVVSQLWQAALGQVAVAAAKRHSVMIHIDEFQDYLRLSGDIADALAQARGLGVGFTLAHQHLSQLPAGLQRAISANARSRVSFALSPEDARVIASTTNGMLVAEDFMSLHAYQAYAQVLADGTTQPPVAISTVPLSAPDRRASGVRAASRARWGRSLDEVESDLIGLALGDQSAESIGRVRRPFKATPASGGTP